MDISLAKRFIYHREGFHSRPERLYISTDLSKIMSVDKYAAELIGVYGVIDTEDGLRLIETTFSFSGEPILLGVFLHEDYFMRFYKNVEKVYLDE